jgi:hypothetical protein
VRETAGKTAERIHLFCLKQLLAHLRPLLLDLLLRAQILEAVDGTHQRAALVEERGDVDQNRHARAIRPFDDDFLVASAVARSQHPFHRGFPVGQVASVQMKQLVRSAKLFIRVAGRGRASPKFDGAPVIGDDDRLGIADIDGGRKDFEKFPREPILSWSRVWHHPSPERHTDDAISPDTAQPKPRSLNIRLHQQLHVGIRADSD